MEGNAYAKEQRSKARRDGGRKEKKEEEPFLSFPRPTSFSILLLRIPSMKLLPL